jgi:hypothetical protein
MRAAHRSITTVRSRSSRFFSIIAIVSGVSKSLSLINLLFRSLSKGAAARLGSAMMSSDAKLVRGSISSELAGGIAKAVTATSAINTSLMDSLRFPALPSQRTALELVPPIDASHGQLPGSQPRRHPRMSARNKTFHPVPAAVHPLEGTRCAYSRLFIEGKLRRSNYASLVVVGCPRCGRCRWRRLLSDPRRPLARSSKKRARPEIRSGFFMSGD